jgi:hypothetical protein
MMDMKKPGGADGTGPGSEIDTRHYPEEAAARQRARLLDHLRRTGITTLEARGRLGIMHPGGRIFELRARGWRIVTTWRRIADEAGRVHRIARYELREECMEGAQ